jgi:hypothetical protein
MYRKRLRPLPWRIFSNTLYKLSNIAVKITAQSANTFDGKSHRLLYIEAFSALFSQASEYFIPSNKLKQYCKLLGVKIDKHFFVTNSTLAKAQNINKIKSHVFAALSNHFRSDIDSLVLLRFFYNVGAGFYGKIIEDGNYAIVTNDSTYQCDNDKYLYTFGQVGCRVVIVQSDDGRFLLSHYRKKTFNKLLSDISGAFANGDNKRLKCFVISYTPIEDCILVKSALSPFCSNIEMYYHKKYDNNDKKASYNIKFCTETDFNIYFAESKAKEFQNLGFLQLYRRATIMICSAIKYKKMSFFKFGQGEGDCLASGRNRILLK